jgi:predicted transcriptional regulator/ribosome-associated translation inhibitor RaiA
MLRPCPSRMNVSEIMISKILSLNLEDTVAKALSVMYDNNINQIPIVDDHQNYGGMIFAKDFLVVNAVPSAKLKTFVSSTPGLSPSDSIEKCAQLIVAAGKRALPVVQNEKIIGIVSETDVALTADFGHAIVDEVMSGAIVIEDDNTLSNAMTKIRRYNISRLPVINSNGVLTGVINALDIIKILATPRERATKSPGVGTMATIREVKVKDIARRSVAVERGTKLNQISEHFRRNEEIIIVGDKRPIGIVTPKDLLEVILPKDSGPSIHMSHLEDNEAQREIEEEMKRFLNKIQGKLESINQVTIYADKHKTRKYSLRARMITRSGVIEAKAVAFDPISACKELISRFDRRIRSEHSQKVKHRQERAPTRTSP